MSEALAVCERVRELDRLYLKHDAILSDAEAATNASAKSLLYRLARRAWRAYAKLRDADYPGRPPFPDCGAYI